MDNEELLALGNTLADSFCDGLDRLKILEAIRRKQETLSTREALVEMWGITEGTVLNRLVEFGLTTETMAAICLTPLVLVAWADGRVDRKERAAIMEAAANAGLESGSVSHMLLDGRLTIPPDENLLETWRAYIRLLASALDEVSMISLRGGLMDQARTIAEASGGILGLGSKVSEREVEVMSQLERAFP